MMEDSTCEVTGTLEDEVTSWEAARLYIRNIRNEGKIWKQRLNQDAQMHVPELSTVVDISENGKNKPSHKTPSPNQDEECVDEDVLKLKQKHRIEKKWSKPKNIVRRELLPSCNLKMYSTYEPQIEERVPDSSPLLKAASVSEGGSVVSCAAEGSEKCDAAVQCEDLPSVIVPSHSARIQNEPVSRNNTCSKSTQSDSDPDRFCDDLGPIPIYTQGHQDREIRQFATLVRYVMSDISRSGCSGVRERPASQCNLMPSLLLESLKGQCRMSSCSPTHVFTDGDRLHGYHQPLGQQFQRLCCEAHAPFSDQPRNLTVRSFHGYPHQTLVQEVPQDRNLQATVCTGLPCCAALHGSCSSGRLASLSAITRDSQTLNSAPPCHVSSLGACLPKLTVPEAQKTDIHPQWQPVDFSTPLPRGRVSNNDNTGIQPLDFSVAKRKVVTSYSEKSVGPRSPCLVPKTSIHGKEINEQQSGILEHSSVPVSSGTKNCDKQNGSTVHSVLYLKEGVEFEPTQTGSADVIEENKDLSQDTHKSQPGQVTSRKDLYQESYQLIKKKLTKNDYGWAISALASDFETKSQVLCGPPKESNYAPSDSEVKECPKDQEDISVSEQAASTNELCKVLQLSDSKDECTKAITEDKRTWNPCVPDNISKVEGNDRHKSKGLDALSYSPVEVVVEKKTESVASDKNEFENSELCPSDRQRTEDIKKTDKLSIPKRKGKDTVKGSTKKRLQMENPNEICGRPNKDVILMQEDCEAYTGPPNKADKINEIKLMKIKGNEPDVQAAENTVEQKSNSNVSDEVKNDDTDALFEEMDPAEWDYVMLVLRQQELLHEKENGKHVTSPSDQRVLFRKLRANAHQLPPELQNLRIFRPPPMKKSPPGKASALEILSMAYTCQSPGSDVPENSTEPDSLSAYKAVFRKKRASSVESRQRPLAVRFKKTKISESITDCTAEEDGLKDGRNQVETPKNSVKDSDECKLVGEDIDGGALKNSEESLQGLWSKISQQEELKVREVGSTSPPESSVPLIKRSQKQVECNTPSSSSDTRSVSEFSSQLEERRKKLMRKWLNVREVDVEGDSEGDGSEGSLGVRVLSSTSPGSSSTTSQGLQNFSKDREKLLGDATVTDVADAHDAVCGVILDKWRSFNVKKVTRRFRCPEMTKYQKAITAALWELRSNHASNAEVVERIISMPWGDIHVKALRALVTLFIYSLSRKAPFVIEPRYACEEKTFSSTPDSNGSLIAKNTEVRVTACHFIKHGDHIEGLEGLLLSPRERDLSVVRTWCYLKLSGCQKWAVFGPLAYLKWARKSNTKIYFVNDVVVGAEATRDIAQGEELIASYSSVEKKLSTWYDLYRYLSQIKYSDSQCSSEKKRVRIS